MLDLTLTSPTDSNSVINQIDYLNDRLHLTIDYPESCEITFINPDRLVADVDLYIRLFNKTSDITINIEEGVSLYQRGIYGAGHNSPDIPPAIRYNLGADSILELHQEVPIRFPIEIYFGDGSSTLIIKPSTSAGSDVSWPILPKIHGLSTGDQIVIQGAKSISYDENTGDLTFFLTNGAAAQEARFNVPNLDSRLIRFEEATGTMGYACFLKGTHIGTPEGEVKVEDLRIGDYVLTAGGKTVPIKWIGNRTLRNARIPPQDIHRAVPITFRKGAIDHNLPHRDLTVSPHHHLFFDGYLIPAMLLVNGKTITQDLSRKVFEYYHIELDVFDIVVAEGMPTESYVDTGNRSMFQNAHTVAMHPDFSSPKGRVSIPGITVVRKGPVVEKIKKRLIDRAEWMETSQSLSELNRCIAVL